MVLELGERDQKIALPMSDRFLRRLVMRNRGLGFELLRQELPNGHEIIAGQSCTSIRECFRLRRVQLRNW